jgi:hypothetical protein
MSKYKHCCLVNVNFCLAGTIKGRLDPFVLKELKFT